MTGSTTTASPPEPEPEPDETEESAPPPPPPPPTTTLASASAPAAHDIIPNNSTTNHATNNITNNIKIAASNTNHNEDEKNNNNNNNNNNTPLQPPLELIPKNDHENNTNTNNNYGNDDDDDDDALSSPPDSPLSDVSKLEAFLDATTTTSSYAAPNLNLNSTPANTNTNTNTNSNHVNGNHPSAEAAVAAEEEGRPAKRRRTNEGTPPPNKQPRRPKPVSPPWKRIEAEGPTTFLDNGKRRSGRTNALPLELQPPGQGQKRTTRVTRQAQQQASPAAKANTTNKQHPTATPNRQVNGTHRASASASASKAPPAPKTPASASSKQASKKPPTNGTRTSPRTRKRSPSPMPHHSPRRPLRSSRSSRNLRDRPESPIRDDSSSSRTTRIRLRVRPTTIPVVHPAQVNVFPGQTLARPKISSDFSDYIQRAPGIDVKDGGWLDSADEGPAYTEEMAEKDAEVILRVEKEVEPGGLLSQERSSVFAPPPVEEPPRQWAQRDHLLKQMAYFRRLMVIEQQRLKSTAKRTAELCRDEWLRRQPKSAEQIEAEARAMWTSRYRLVVKVLAGTWENVKTEINHRRLEEWKAAEQQRANAALNEVVDKSEMKLQARAHGGSEIFGEDEDEEDLDEDDDLDDSDGEALLGDDEDRDDDQSSDHDVASDTGLNEDEDNMSSDEDDDEDAKSTISDEGLTQEQLRQKYANVPDLPRPPSDVPADSIQPDDLGETSDESVDMDDDLGSSEDEMDSDDEGAEDEEEEEESEEEEPSGLLGLFFGKSELKKLKDEVPATDENPAPTEDVEMQDGPVSTQDETPIVNGHATAEIASADADAPPKAAEETSTTANAEISTAQGSDARLPNPDSGEESQKNTDSSSLIAPPTNPLDADKPDAPPTAPGPLQAQNVEMEIQNTIRQVQDDAAHDKLKSSVPSVPTAVSSVEPTSAQDRPQESSDADAVTSPLSRDRSQSPRTSDTKPSEDDTAPTTIKSTTSRSASPQIQQVPKTEVPFLLRGSLREYQHYGLDWLAGLYKNKTNGILADEMGLGKTIQTIALLAHLACHHEVWGPHLVVVPTSVMLNWEMEFKKWCPGFKVMSYYGSIEERKRKRQGWSSDDMWNVCITSYQIVLQDQQVFKRRQWHYMILDEAHNIKNFKSKRWQTLLTFNTRARLLLTGTPLQNNLTELWSLLFFLMPSEDGENGFVNLAGFQDWFRKPETQILESGREQLDDEARKIIAKLHKVLRPYLLRRLKADVEKQMPAKYEHVEFCRLSRRQRELYDGFLAQADTREALSSGNYISVINCLMQLRKVCNHPDLFVERPIMTSFRQSRSVVSEYEPTDKLVRSRLLAEDPMKIVNKSFLNLVPADHEPLSKTDCERVAQLSSHQTLMDLREVQRARAQAASTKLDPTTVESNITYLESAARWGRFEELQHCVYLNALRRQQHPIYGKQLTDFLTLGVNERPHKPRPKVPRQVMSWFEEDSPTLRSMVLTLDRRADSMKTTISKFACITPAVVTRDMDRFVLGSKGVEAFTDADLKLSAPVRYAPFMPKEPPPDPWHESRMRLSIQFPDKRLLQYDCGKLQALDRLLRKLQAGGHRALIFTQMTKVLDILEQFLNIHGHKYLRLDGATKVEQRQILTDRFNHDTRILCFILSTRSGGLGINLTGADTVIFYDQDWNPAMDKQCQDRCHRIGQTRDVHIYRLVSEHTIEANILRKASQKQMLDDVVIQEGGFTTDYFTKMASKTASSRLDDGAGDVVGDAMDRVLGGVVESAAGRVLEQAEDTEDVAAARVAEREIREDEADFAEKPLSGSSSARQNTPTTTTTTTTAAAPLTSTGRDSIGPSNLGLYAETAEDLQGVDGGAEVEYGVDGELVRTIDEYMLATMAAQLAGTPLELPREHRSKKAGAGRGKKGKDVRKL